METRASLMSLPEDVLLCLFIFLDMKTMLSMQSISPYFKEKIRNIFKLTEKTVFLEKIVANSLTQEQFEGLPLDQRGDYKKWLLPYFVPLKTMRSHLANNRYYQPCILRNLFNSQPAYFESNCSGVTFNLKEIKPLLLKDEAAKLLAKVSRIGDLTPVIQKDHFDVIGSLKIFKLIEEKVKSIIVGDVSFIGLVPLIMDFRALKCFDLFLQAYLIMIMVFPSILNNPLYELKTLGETILNQQDDFFYQRFLSLMLMCYSTESITLYNQIKFAVDANKAHLVRNAIETIPPEKKQAFFAAWRKLDTYHDLLHKLYPIEQGKNELMKALNYATKLLEDHHITVEELVSLQANIQSRFEKCIKLSSDESHEDSVRKVWHMG